MKTFTLTVTDQSCHQIWGWTRPYKCSSICVSPCTNIPCINKQLNEVSLPWRINKMLPFGVWRKTGSMRNDFHNWNNSLGFYSDCAFAPHCLIFMQNYTIMIELISGIIGHILRILSRWTQTLVRLRKWWKNRPLNTLPQRSTIHRTSNIRASLTVCNLCEASNYFTLQKQPIMQLYCKLIFVITLF